MSEFRRKLIMAAILDNKNIDSEYVKDGLTFHLDGFNKGGVPDKWVDLISGKSFDNHGCTFLGNGISFNGIDNYLTCDDTEVMGTDQLGTIEVCFESLLDRVQMIYSHCSPSLCAILEKSKFYYSYNITARFQLENMQKHTISVHNNFAVQNLKNVVRGNEQTYRANNNKIIIGVRGDLQSRFFNGTIHSIRIYNRQLTKEEMLHNQQVDIDRFFGGITPQ